MSPVPTPPGPPPERVAQVDRPIAPLRPIHDGASREKPEPQRLDGKERPNRPVLVRAAGALCWRRAPEPGTGLLVLLVHRPRYQDWSWPKGKVEGGERLPATAVREVEEETGLSITLGPALPSARYPLGTEAIKYVGYWAAWVPGDDEPAPPNPDEVDRTEWVTPAEADARLTRRADRVQLRALLAADAAGTLDTWPLLVLRHGYARPKTSWSHADDERPLIAAGMRQAEALPSLLTAWAPDRVYCSPWERCQATVRPYLAASGASLRLKTRLSEEGHRRDAEKVEHLVAKLIARGSPAIICTHRPVLPTLLACLSEHAEPLAADALPRHDPYLSPGEVFVAHVSRSRGLVVAIERHHP